MPLTASLRPWAALNDGSWQSLLLGNGSSIAVSPDFAYGSLFVQSGLSAGDRRLFRLLDTSNFETALNALRVARLVCEQEGHGDDARRRYRTVRRALVRAVNTVHIQWQSVPVGVRRQMRSGMLGFRTVYSTNYDLLLYWAVMTDRPSDFRDYFWGQGASFDRDDVDIPAGVTRILYLHGALHLYRLADGGAAKLVATGRNLLSTMSAATAKIPLFVCEGRSRNKQVAIARSDYLSFALSEFQCDESPLVVFGHSLSEEDAHLLPPMNQRRRRVAVSLLPGPPASVLRRKAELKERLPRARLSFFDATTHPLGEASMRCEP